MAMKDLLKKMGNQDETEDLNTGYNDDYYDGAYNEPPRHQDDGRQNDGRQNSRRQQDGSYEEYDRRERRQVQDDRNRYPDEAYNEPPYVSRRQGNGYEENSGRNGYGQPAEERPRRRTVMSEPDPIPRNAGTLYFTPDAYKDDRKAIADGLRGSHVVVISVARLSQSDIARLSDFVLGVSLALEGELYRLNRTTIVMEPKGVEVDPDELELPDEEEPAEGQDEYGDEDSEQDETDDN